jgi:protein-S-isoprenylcysteine O-methyltransferase Ste14
MLTYAWFALAAVTFLVLQFISAPYGKHVRAGWGPTMPNHIGWMVMETPPIVIFIALYATGDRVGSPVATTFLVLFLAHYVYRGWVYPFRLRTTGKRMPVLICALALLTNIGIGWIQASWLFSLSEIRGLAYFGDARFVVGVALFGFGYWLNHDSDARLRNLRKPRETGYKIPRGGGFRFVSSPHYLGEIVEWTGWALATWSLPTLAFLAWTMANLTPRANETHQWYLDKFEDYPKSRKRLIPFLY